MLVMAYVAAAYVIVCTVEAGVDMSIGFYYNYAGASSVGDLLYLFEVILILAWQMWAFITPIMATMLASEVWNQLDTRVAEARLDSKGFDTAVSWDLAIKTATLLLLVGSMTVVAGFSLGDIAGEAITWVAKYEDDVNKEASQKQDPSQKTSPGTAAQEDVTLHMITSAIGLIVFTTISVGSFVFAYQFLDLTNGGEDFECDVKEASAGAYSALDGLFGLMVDKKSCLENMDKVYDIIDLNGDNYYSRCEDAKFQYAYGGSSVSYSKKFSQAFTRASAYGICNDFPY